MTGNWGKWGDKDQRGTLNYITRDVVQDSTKLVKKGKVYSLALPIQQTGVPVFTDRGRRVNCIHFMRWDGGDFAAGSIRVGQLGICASDDYLLLGGHSTTHIDALCHMWYEDHLYNGFSANTLRSSGAKYCGVDKLQWIITRGIMLDIPQYKNLEHLEAGYVITPEDLEGCMKKQGVALRPGDALLVRTGWLKTYFDNPGEWEKSQPGIGLESVPLITENQISVVGADNAAFEAYSHDNMADFMAVHGKLLRDYGTPIIEMLVLDELARDQVYQFQFLVAPLIITGGTASAVNPLALC